MSLLRSTIIWLLLGTWTLSLGAFANIVALFGGQWALYRLARIWARIGLGIAGIDVEVEGKERFHTDGPVIVLLNHQGFADIPSVYMASPVPLGWMAKHSLFKIPIFGRAMRLAGAIPVERTDRRKSMDSLFQAAETIRRGQTVVIFPEGTRSFPSGKMRPFKKGAFVLAKKAAVTLQPITIWGSHAATPHGDRKRIPRIQATTVRVVIHEPIAPEAYASLSAAELSELVRGVLAGPLDRLRAFHECLDTPIKRHSRARPSAARRAARGGNSRGGAESNPAAETRPR